MTPHEKYINGLAEMIHADCVNVGWWDDPDRCLYTCIQLISTEISEATEGARKDLMDTHLPHYKMEEVEYADAFIRLMDLAGKLNLRYDEEYAVPHAWALSHIPIGKQQLGINVKIIEFAHALMDYEHQQSLTYRELIDHAYSDLVKTILQVAHNRGFSFYEAVEEKIEYNRTRQDHKRENRVKKGGKKW